MQRYSTVRDKSLIFFRLQGIEDFRTVTGEIVERYAAYLHKKKYATNSIYLECTTLKQVVAWLISRKLLPESHRIKLAVERSSESSTYCFTPEQVQTMVVWCKGQPSLQWLAPLLAFLASTGTRIGEALSLRWSEIDLTTGFIKIVDNRHSAIAQKAQAVRKTKGSRSRQVPVHPDLRSELDSLARRADGQVFSAYRGARPDADRIREQFVRHVIEPLKTRWPTAVGDIGFEHGRLHSFRHYFVSQAFLGGASEGEIREWVGHRDSRIVERYRHLRAADSLRKMSQLQLLAGAGEAIRKPAET